jgi:hypothetical protein
MPPTRFRPASREKSTLDERQAPISLEGGQIPVEGPEGRK